MVTLSFSDYLSKYRNPPKRTTLEGRFESAQAMVKCSASPNGNFFFSLALELDEINLY